MNPEVSSHSQVLLSSKDRKSFGNEGGSGQAALTVVKEDVSVSLAHGGSGPFGVWSLSPCLSMSFSLWLLLFCLF